MLNIILALAIAILPIKLLLQTMEAKQVFSYL